MQRQKQVAQHLIPITSANQSTQWLQAAKIELKKRTRSRLYKRINIIEEIVNKNIPSIHERFIIDAATKQLICNKLFIKIESYVGTKQLRKGQEKSEADVIKKTRIWWNRTKATALGSILFTQICFINLHNFIQQHCDSLLGLKKLFLFIKIFNAFLSHSVKFPQTKPQPLIPHACFCVDGQFRNICYAFIRTFGDSGIKWLPYVKKFKAHIKNGKKIYEYIKGKHRCLKLFTDFVQCLNKILIKYKFRSDESEDVLLMKWNETLNHYVQLQTDCSDVSQITKESDINNIKLSATCTITVECHSDHEIIPPFTSTNTSNIVNVENYGYSPSESLDSPIPRPFQFANQYIHPTNRVHFMVNKNLKVESKGNLKIERHIQSMRESMFSKEYHNINIQQCDMFK